ncbi:Nuclear control of ATPase protein 2 [Coemansia javaensis]|uniref:Nuclear control of ATPase protein 2 n=1 Tax=Coemansia javaensis TaxID=2761396 RepID=A0A9W8LMA5_9FUNG|nr:Nuclear control of ATPase protein 2 [Coemansia javaensis]
MTFVDEHYARVLRLLAPDANRAPARDPGPALGERAFALATRLLAEPREQPAEPESGACPPLASAAADLRLVRAAVGPADGVAALASEQPAAALVLASAVAAIHAHAVGQLLEAVLPLSVSIEYWAAQDAGAASLAAYLVQSLPQRLGRWAWLACSGVAGLAPGSTGGRLRWLASSRSLFPAADRQRRAPGERQGGLLRLAGVPDGVNVLGLVRHEVRYNQHRLVAMQQQLAGDIGLLSQAALAERDCADGPLGTARLLLLQVAATAERLTGDAISAATEAPGPGGMAELMDLAEGVAGQVQRISAAVGLRVRESRRPSLLARCWLPAALALAGARWLSSYISGHREGLREWLADGLFTARNYVLQYILAPLRSGYETIRYGRHTYSVMTEESLASDLRSLEGMAVGFAGRLSGADAAAVRLRVQQGDLSDVMQVYAREMQQPIRNAVFGDLVEAMLIQVQKVKVDVGQTMAALDKLLKSNELNFLLLSTVPATLSIYAAARWLSAWLSWWVSGGSRSMVASMQAIVRDIDRLLGAAGAAAQLPAAAQGRLICLTHYLRHHAQRLPNAASAGTLQTPAGRVPTLPRTRELFLQDIRDLEGVATGVAQKQRIVDRMYRTFRFL